MVSSWNGAIKGAATEYRGTVHAIKSIEIIDSIKKIWFWRRKREWNSKWKKIASQIVSEVGEIRKSYFELDSMDSENKEN